jgi:versiconal hemiacetal acetate esterase
MCRYLAQHSQVIIAQVDFRMAPEHPVPAQVEDCTTAYKWVSHSYLFSPSEPFRQHTADNSGQCHANAEKLHGDPNRFFAIGSSLGGGAAVGVALKLIDENLEDLVKGIVALVPALIHPDFVPQEYKGMFTAYKEMWNGAPLQDGESMMVFYGECKQKLSANFDASCFLLDKKDLRWIYALTYLRPQRRNQAENKSLRLPMHTSWPAKPPTRLSGCM